MKKIFVKTLVLVAAFTVTGCSTVPHPVIDTRFCLAGAPVTLYKLDNEYYTSVVYKCADIMPKDLKGATIVPFLPPDAQFIGGQMISFKKSGTPLKQLDEVYHLQPNSIGANILIEDATSATTSPETHYYRLFYSQSK